MSELKQLVEKFIELDDELNVKIEKELENSEELPESFEDDNKEQIAVCIAAYFCTENSTQVVLTQTQNSKLIQTQCQIKPK